MRISQLLSYLLLFLALLAVLACVTTPPPTAERKPTPTPAPTVTLTPPATSFLGPAESPVPAATSAPTDAPTQAPVPTATPVPTLPPSQAIASLEWVNDGISSTEAALVEQLEIASATSQRYFRALMNAPWVRQKTGTHRWGPVVGGLNELAALDEYAAIRMIELELAETVEYADPPAIESMLSLATLDPRGVNLLLTNTSVEETDRDGWDGFLPLLYLDMHDPEAATTIRALPWVRDGLENEDVPFVAELANMAKQSPQAFRAVLHEKSEWLPPPQGTSALPEALKLISSIASGDEEAALRIIDLPYLDRMDPQDFLALESLAALVESSPQRLQEVMSDPVTTSDGGSLFSTIVLLMDLRLRDPEASEVLEGLPWVQEGIGKVMVGAVSGNAEQLRQDAADVLQLLLLLKHDPPSGRELFLTAAAKNWMRNGLLEHEREVVTDATAADRRYRERAARSIRGNSLDAIAELPWVRFGDQRYHYFSVLSLVRLGTLEDEWLFRLILERPWVNDGLSGPEASLIRSVAGTFGGATSFFDLEQFEPVGDYELAKHLLSLFLQRRDPAAGDAIEALPWVQDGIDESKEDWGELEFLHTLMYAWRNWRGSDFNPGGQMGESTNLFLYLLKEPWVRDEVEEHDEGMLGTLANMPVGLVGRLLPMPFLDTVEPGERDLVYEFYRVNAYQPSTLERLMARPEYAGGLTDDNLAEAVEVLRSLVT